MHVFVLGEHGPLRYLDLYRHALVEVTGIDTDIDTARPGAGEVRVVLAARHTDFPAFYGVLRSALADLEVGVNARALVSAAELFSVGAEVRVSGVELDAADTIVRATGPGSWSAPVVITLTGCEVPATTDLDPAGGDVDDIAGVPAADVMLEASGGDAGLREIAALTSFRLGRSGAATELARSIPARHQAGPALSWARVQWERSAGRVPAHRTGFSAMPAQRDESCLRTLLDWATVPAPDPEIGAVARDVAVHVVVQGWTGRADGHYRVDRGELVAVSRERGMAARLEEAFGYPLTAANDCGVRHASATFLLCAEPGSIVADHGPAGWSLLQLWCGWVAHGVSTAAAASTLFARPARSFDEYRVAHVLGLPPAQVPVFTVVCGQTRYAEPMLDLRPC